MAYEFIDKEQPAHPVNQVPSYDFQDKPQGLWQDIADKVWSLPTSVKVWAWAAAALPTAYWAWSALKNIGKMIYSLPISKSTNEAEALQNYRAWISDIKPRSTVTSMLENSSVVSPWKVIARDPLRAIKWLSPFNMAGTEAKIWVDAANKAQNIFTKVINPAFQKADKMGIKIWVDDIFDKAIQAAENNKRYDPVTKAWAKAAIEDMRSEYKAAAWDTMSLQNLHNTKSNIQWFTSKKVLNNEISPSDLQNARGIVWNTMKDTLHNTMKEKFGIDSATKYRDYANLQSAADKWILDMTAQKLDQWAGSLVSSLVKKWTTPVATNIGKVTFDLWRWLQFLPKTIVKAAKATPEFLKSVVKNSPNIIKWFIRDLPVWVAAWEAADSIANSQWELHDNVINDLQTGINLLSSWKNIPFNNISWTLIKWKNKEEWVRILQQELEKMKATKRPEKIKNGIDLLWELFK